MEAAVVTAEPAPEPAAVEQPPEPAARVSASKLFKYSEFVDVGEGAVECEHARDGQCGDTEHFHAWIRLPNPFQHEDIRKKALAAKARKIRELRDPDSDASVVLDAELLSGDPALVERLVEELLAASWAEDYLAAQRVVEEREGFEYVAQDQEEHNRLKPHELSLPEEERSEEFKRLAAHMNAYVEALRDELENIQRPKREELVARDADSLIALARARRVEEEGDREFMEVYNAWMWFVGAFKVELHPTLNRPHIPMWDDRGHKDRPDAGTMFGAEPEVIAALKTAFNGLQVAQQRGLAGN